MDETNPKDLIGETKPPLHLIPPAANIEEAVVMGLGAKKYGPYNWRQKQVKASVYVAAAQRHLAEWFDGQNNDPQSGASHLAHARSCLGILLDAKSLGQMVDDRPPPGCAAELIDMFTERPLEVVMDEVNLELLTVDPEDTYEEPELLNERTGLPPRKPPETAQDWLQFS